MTSTGSPHYTALVHISLVIKSCVVHNLSGKNPHYLLLNVYSKTEVIMLIILCLEFPVIFLHYVPTSIHYSQDHCQSNPVTPEKILYCNS